MNGFVAAWNDHDLEAFLTFAAEDVFWDDPAMEEPARGRGHVTEFARTLFRAFPDLRYEVLDSVVLPSDDGNGGRMIIHWRMSGTQTGPLHPPGFAPTRRPIEFDGVDLVRIRDGVVQHAVTRFDSLVLLEQLGLLPPRPAPGSLLERILVTIQRLIAPWLRARARRRAR